jgi:hypothetical protein
LKHLLHSLGVWQTSFFGWPVFAMPRSLLAIPYNQTARQCHSTIAISLNRRKFVFLLCQNFPVCVFHFSLRVAIVLQPDRRQANLIYDTALYILRVVAGGRSLLVFPVIIWRAADGLCIFAHRLCWGQRPGTPDSYYLRRLDVPQWHVVLEQANGSSTFFACTVARRWHVIH